MKTSELLRYAAELADKLEIWQSLYTTQSEQIDKLKDRIRVLEGDEVIADETV